MAGAAHTVPPAGSPHAASPTSETDAPSGRPARGWARDQNQPRGRARFPAMCFHETEDPEKTFPSAFCPPNKCPEPMTPAEVPGGLGGVVSVLARAPTRVFLFRKVPSASSEPIS